MSLKSIIGNIKLESQDTKQTEVEKSVIPLFNWKIVFFSMLGFTVFAAVIAKRYYNILKNMNIYNSMSLKFLEYFLYIVIINMFLFTLTASNYTARLAAAGLPGPKGDIGEKGMNGKNAKCDICTKKYNTFKRENKVKKTNFVADISDILEQEGNVPTGWDNSKFETEDSRFDYDRGINLFKDDIKYLVGVVASYNSQKGVIETIQFIVMTDKSNQVLLGQPIGKKITNETKQVTYTCPNNYGVSNMDVNLGYDPDKKCYILKGLQLGFSQLVTGKPSNQSFSIGSRSTDSNIINVPYRAGFKEHNGEYFPSFISGLAILGNEDFVENVTVTNISTEWL